VAVDHPQTDAIKRGKNKDSATRTENETLRQELENLKRKIEPQ
jgi:hypothetical protein